MDSQYIDTDQSVGCDGYPIYYDQHYPGTVLYHPPEVNISGLLVCAHGFKGYKDYGFLPLLCTKAVEAGMTAIRFNFSHSGMTNHVETFEHPERFEKDRWSKQIYDLQRMLSPWDDSSGTLPPVVIFGHSRGGITTLLTAARHNSPDFYKQGSQLAWIWPLINKLDLRGVITAAAPDYACNLDDLAKEQLRTEGRLLSPSGRTGQDLYVGRDWLDEIERDPDLYDPVLAAAHVKCPTLILHGSGDTTVPVECAHNLHRAATPNSRLEIIDGASHVFDCPNPLPIDTPWEDVPAATRELIDLTVAFAVEQCEKARG